MVAHSSPCEFLHSSSRSYKAVHPSHLPLSLLHHQFAFNLTHFRSALVVGSFLSITSTLPYIFKFLVYHTSHSDIPLISIGVLGNLSITEPKANLNHITMHAALVSLVPVLALMADQTAAHPVKKNHNLAEGFFKREVPQGGSILFVTTCMSKFD